MYDDDDGGVQGLGKTHTYEGLGGRDNYVKTKTCVAWMVGEHVLLFTSYQKHELLRTMDCFAKTLIIASW